MQSKRERSWRSVPRGVLGAMALFFALQVGWHARQPAPVAVAEDLSTPPPPVVLRALSLGDPVFLSYFLLLRLQAFDNQPGISIPFKDLDYTKVVEWLKVCLDLDPATQYPLLLAATVYSQVPDEPKQRMMLDFVFRQFLDDPPHRWQWLAHASVMARHALRDLPLSLKYAQALADHAGDAPIPSWARQMHIFLRADMGEHEAAKVLLGGLLASGTIQDPHEIAFLMQRIEMLENAEKSPLQSKN
ncbi:MAG: hypothetical protein U1E63_00625 [Burkholderiales bacterium]|nr:hypothetical protein [Betaproteobacteria bacterium]